MPSDPTGPDPDPNDGLAIARARIAAEKKARTGFLDLGRLGLEEWPEELWELDHLVALNLGFGGVDQDGEWRSAESKLAPNTLAPDAARWSRLPRLRHLSISGMGWESIASLAGLVSLQSLDCCQTQVGDLGPLAGFASLKSLECSYTRVSDLGPLAGLASLLSLNCSVTPVRGLGPLARLASLQSLNCSGTKVSDIGPLAELVSLRSLNCSNTQVSDFGPLAGLADLEYLDCARTPLSDLSPLAGLTSLQSLACSSTPVGDIGPLVGLASLQSLNCSETHVGDLGPLAGLSSLQSLNCSETQVGDLGPLAGLASLQSLVCHNTQVSDLGPLAGLPGLATLFCSYTPVSDLSPLAGLAGLAALNCSGTPVSDLSPLAGLVGLEALNCSGTQVAILPDGLVYMDSLRHLVLCKTAIRDIPAEVLSPGYGICCLETLRAHLRDLEAGEALVPDVKVLVLGNGRIGKTQICNRLRGLAFEPEADSTHGITVAAADAGAGTRLRLWDFGGQDLYHGTHALFLRSRAVFLLVWTPRAEDCGTHEHGGMTFRNRRLAWWLACVRHLAGPDSPVLVVQNQCDRPEDERVSPPLEEAALGEHRWRKVLHYSALNERGGPALRDALADAVQWLRQEQGQARIGRGRLAVKERIEALQAADAQTAAPAQRRHRTMTVESFAALCAECGGVSSPALLLDYLHQTGVVFHREGLFGGQIILDQAWALEAVYAVFNRQRCWQQLRHAKGRFTRSLLEALVWQEHSEGEQELFLSMMQQCGICFVHRRGDEKRGIETEYIAPDLLPDRAEVEGAVEAQWHADAPGLEGQVRVAFLHEGLMRGLLSRIGREAGDNAVYWKQGACLYERTTRSHALITEEREETERAWPGRITVRTQGGDADGLLRMLLDWVTETARGLGLKEETLTMTGTRDPNPQARDPDPPAAATPMVFAPAPRPGPTYAVSYAWQKESEATVDKLCAEAEERGVHILRDKTDMGIGEEISKFMRHLAAQDRVFVVLSRKYLESANCMYELYHVWLNCRGDAAEFRQRIRVFRLPDAVIRTPVDRVQWALYWQEQAATLKKLVRKGGPEVLGEADFRAFKNMQQFAAHVGDMLATIYDTLRPKDWTEFVAHGFGD